jgi:hypothetical protein
MGAKAFLHRVAAIGAAAAASALLVTCDNPTYFSDYSGTNLVAGSPLGSGDWVADQSAPYMRFEEVTNAGDRGDTSALPDGDSEPVYRVEIENLFPNGGFEDTSPGTLPSQWTNNGANTAEVVPGTDSKSIDRRSFYIEFGDSSNRVYANLNNLFANGFEADRAYSFRFDFKAITDTFGAELNDNGGNWLEGHTWSVSRPAGMSADDVLNVPEKANFSPNNVLSPDGSFGYFSFGGYSDTAESIMSATVDNFQIICSDLTYAVRLPMARTAPARPDLVSGGTYRFSLWIRTDPTAVDPAPGSNNRFPADAVTLGLNSEPEDKVYDVSRTVQRGSDDWSSWTEVSAELPGPQVSSTLDQQDPVVEFYFMPSEPGALASASILVAHPSIEWSPE